MNRMSKTTYYDRRGWTISYYRELNTKMGFDIQYGILHLSDIGKWHVDISIKSITFFTL